MLHALTKSGGIRSEFTIVRLAEEHYYLTSAAAAERHDFDLLRSHAARFDGITLSNETARFGVICVAGPQARHVLGQISEADLGNDSFSPGCRQETSSSQADRSAHSASPMSASLVGSFTWERIFSWSYFPR